MPHKHKGPTKAKARKILKHGRVRGKKLTAKQKRFMGAKSAKAKRRRKRR